MKTITPQPIYPVAKMIFPRCRSGHAASFWKSPSVTDPCSPPLSLRPSVPAPSVPALPDKLCCPCAFRSLSCWAAPRMGEDRESPSILQEASPPLAGGFRSPWLLELSVAALWCLCAFSHLSLLLLLNSQHMVCPVYLVPPVSYTVLTPSLVRA